MRTYLFGFIVLLSASSFLAAQSGPAPDKDYATKIKALQDQIDALVKQQEALRKEQEEHTRALKAKLDAEKAKREAEKAKQYAKVEIRGRLGTAPAKTVIPMGRAHLRIETWHVAVQAMVVPVDVSGETLRELAKQHAGKEVIITGAIDFGTIRTPIVPVDGFGRPHPEHDPFSILERSVTTAAVRAESLKLAEK